MENVNRLLLMLTCVTVPSAVFTCRTAGWERGDVVTLCGSSIWGWVVGTAATILSCILTPDLTEHQGTEHHHKPRNKRHCFAGCC